jgi:hypothetical protein
MLKWCNCMFEDKDYRKVESSVATRHLLSACVLPQAGI